MDIVKDDNGGWVKMSRAMSQPEKFDILSDEFVEKSIQHSRGPALAQARDILERIQTRNIYKLVYYRDYVKFVRSAKQCQEQLVEMAKREKMNLVEGDLAVMFRKINMGGGNPLEKAVFNDKDRPGVHYTISKEMVKHLIPRETATVTVMVVCKKKGEEATKQAKQLANYWAKMMETEEDVLAMPDDRVLVPM